MDDRVIAISSQIKSEELQLENQLEFWTILFVLLKCQKIDWLVQVDSLGLAHSILFLGNGMQTQMTT